MSSKYILLKKFLASLPAGIPYLGDVYEAFVSKLDEKEKHDFAEQIKNIAILQKKKSYLEIINDLDLRPEDIIEQERWDQLLQVVDETSESDLLSSHPEAFYSGGIASSSDIAANLDILRTQYISDWMDIQGVPQKAWKSLLFKQTKKKHYKRR